MEERYTITCNYRKTDYNAFHHDEGSMIHLIDIIDENNLLSILDQFNLRVLNGDDYSRSKLFLYSNIEEHPEIYISSAGLIRGFIKLTPVSSPCVVKYKKLDRDGYEREIEEDDFFNKTTKEIMDYVLTLLSSMIIEMKYDFLIDKIHFFPETCFTHHKYYSPDIIPECMNKLHGKYLSIIKRIKVETL